MPKRSAFVPQYCLHKPSGRAYVRIHGKVIYCGVYGTDESKQAYGRLIAELAAKVTTPPVASTVLVVELIGAYWEYAQGYYVKDGKATSTLDGIRQSLHLLRTLYGNTPLNDFGPKAIKAIRHAMIESKRLNRSTINKRIDTIRRMFRWGVAEEIVSPSLYQSLQAVGGLRKGRTEARETTPIGPVPVEDPRFVVTSLSTEEFDARALYEDLYCARGEMENRIKEQQLCLFADRTSCATMRANQLRLWLSSVAYTLLVALRQFGLQGTEMSHSRCDTIRLKLLKIGALVRTTVRRVWISLSESCPYQRLFAQVYDNLRRWFLPLPAS